MPLATFPSLIDRLRAIVGPAGLLHSPSDLVVYECDGFTIEKNKPDVVVFPTSTEQIVAIVKACYAAFGRGDIATVIARTASAASGV